jgi:hypothetical protein
VNPVALHRFTEFHRRANGARILSIHVSLDNHLRDTLSTKGLAANESLASDSGEEIADGSEGKEDSRGDETGRVDKDAEELYERQNSVGSCPEVVGRDHADVGIELARSRADSEEQRYFDEENEERGGSACVLERDPFEKAHGTWHVGICGIFRLQCESIKDVEENVCREDVGDTKCEAQDH